MENIVLVSVVRLGSVGLGEDGQDWIQLGSVRLG